jgi:hypothetical protein
MFRSQGKLPDMLTYYDHHLGRERIKRRYSWAAWAFIGGLIAGVIAAHLL